MDKFISEGGVATEEQQHQKEDSNNKRLLSTYVGRYSSIEGLKSEDTDQWTILMCYTVACVALPTPMRYSAALADRIIDPPASHTDMD